MHPNEFLQQKKERDEKKKRRTIIACIVVCVVWIPIALFLYKPASLFGGNDQSNIASSDG